MAIRAKSISQKSHMDKFVINVVNVGTTAAETATLFYVPVAGRLQDIRVTSAHSQTSSGVYLLRNETNNGVIINGAMESQSSFAISAVLTATANPFISAGSLLSFKTSSTAGTGKTFVCTVTVDIDKRFQK